MLVSSAVLATAFVFGTTAATMFRALLMIFYTNPFGLGIGFAWMVRFYRFGNSV